MYGLLNNLTLRIFAALALGVAAGTLGMSVGAQAQDPQPQPGRYQITGTMKAVYLLDTATGSVCTVGKGGCGK